MSTNAVFDGGAADQLAEYAAAASGHDYTDADHETFLEDKDAISGLDLEPADVSHVAPAVDRTALCLEGTGIHLRLAEVLATSDGTACRECLALADVLDRIEMYDLARLAAGVASDVTVLPITWRLDTEALPVRDLATRDVVAVRLLIDPAVPLSVIKADLWQEIRAERPQVYAALCDGNIAAAYAAEAAL